MKRILWAAVLAVLAMRLHNAFAFPVERGYDFVGHLQAVRVVAQEGRLPLPTDGWAGYHPPLYYLLGGVLGHPQLLSTLASLAAILLIWWPARRLAPGYELAALAFVAALPAEVIVSPMVYNVPLGYFFASLFLALAVEVWLRPAPGLGWAVGLGLVAGLGVLARPDCLMLMVFQAVLWGVRRRWLHLLLGSGVAVGTCGWWFLRNLAGYGRLVLANTDPELFPHFFSESWLYLPGFRSAGYYLWPDLSVWLYPAFPQGYPSYWGTMFGSLWWDYYGCFYPTVPIWGARLYLVAGVAGLALVAWGLREAPFPLWLNLGLTLALQLAHSLRLPEDGAVKAVYLYTAFTALGLVFALGCRRLDKPAWIHGILATWCCGVAYTFWF